MYAPTSLSEAAAYLVIENTNRPDTLVSISSPLATAVRPHRQETTGSMVQMIPISHLVIPRGVTQFAPGGTHLMLTDLNRVVVRGDSVTLTLSFSLAGTRTIQLPVIDYGDSPPVATEHPR